MNKLALLLVCLCAAPCVAAYGEENPAEQDRTPGRQIDASGPLTYVIPIHGSINKVCNVCHFTFTYAHKFLIQGVSNSGVKSIPFQHHYVGAVQDWSKFIWHTIGDIGKSYS